MKNNENFNSKLGAILAAAGSAVGLGNIWRFPTETGNNGGAAFIIIYIICMLLLGVPIMVSEFAIGRHSQQSVTQSFLSMSNGKKGWKYMGLIPVVAGVLVLSYYAVVAGWTLYYTFLSAINGFAGKASADYANDFISFSSDPWQPIIWMALIIALTGIIVAFGVQKGIEKSAKIMMPMLFVFILILAGYSFTLPGAKEGLTFMLKPDFSKVDSSTVLNALGQAFFSLSAGICCLCTYACYFRKDINLMKDGLNVAIIDTFVAIFAGFIIFPAVFSVEGITPDQGPSLVFITLPNVFQQIMGEIPVITYLFPLIFYLLLVMAALTSSISMLEMAVAYFHENFKLNRIKSVTIVCLLCLVLGSFCSLSFGAWKDVAIFGLGFFDLFDFIVAKLMMPIGGLLICIFLGWVVDKRILKDEISNNGTLRAPYYPVYRFIIRYLAPICIILIFVNELIKQ